MVPKTIHEYESTHAAKEHGLTKSATSPIQKVRKILDTTGEVVFSRPCDPLGQGGLPEQLITPSGSRAIGHDCQRLAIGHSGKMRRPQAD